MVKKAAPRSKPRPASLRSKPADLAACRFFERMSPHLKGLGPNVPPELAAQIHEGDRKRWGPGVDDILDRLYADFGSTPPRALPMVLMWGRKN